MLLDTEKINFLDHVSLDVMDKKKTMFLTSSTNRVSTIHCVLLPGLNMNASLLLKGGCSCSQCFPCASVAKQRSPHQCFIAMICVCNLPLISPGAEKSPFFSPCRITVLESNPLWGHKVHLHQLYGSLHCRSLAEVSFLKKKNAKKHLVLIIMHFIVNETNNSQVFQCQHLTEQRYKKEKIIPYKTPKSLIITLLMIKTQFKDRMQIFTR